MRRSVTFPFRTASTSTVLAHTSLNCLMTESEGERPSEPDNPPQRSLPWFIISLVIVSWVLFLYSLYKNNCPSRTARDKCLLHGYLGRLSFQPFRQNPQFGPARSTLVDLGGLGWDFKKEQTKKWHILSSIFVHRGVVDLSLDTISLLYMGMELERNFGTAKIGSLYILSSLGGSLWASLKFKGPVYVGGSSGICGLTGGALAEFLINFHLYEEKFKKFLSLFFGAAINFTITFFPRADIFGNIGGMYLGLLFGFVLLIRRQPESAGYEYKRSGLDPQQLIFNYNRYQRVLWVISLISAIIQFMYSLINFILH